MRSKLDRRCGLSEAPTARERLQTELVFHTLVYRKVLSVGSLWVTRDIKFSCVDSVIAGCLTPRSNNGSSGRLQICIHPATEEALSPGSLQGAPNRVWNLQVVKNGRLVKFFCANLPSNGTRGTRGGEKTLLFQPEDLFTRADFPLCVRMITKNGGRVKGNRHQPRHSLKQNNPLDNSQVGDKAKPRRSRFVAVVNR